MIIRINTDQNNYKTEYAIIWIGNNAWKYRCSY